MQFDPGEHELEAIVWWLEEPDSIGSRTDQEGADPTPTPPMGQMSLRGGFLVYSEDLQPDVLNTGSADWQVADLTDAVELFRPYIPHYFDVGPSHIFDLARWKSATKCGAKVICAPLITNDYGVRRPGWCLAPANLPEQSRSVWIGGRIRAVRDTWHASAVAPQDEKAALDWSGLSEGKPTIFPPNTEWTIIWDLEKYRCGYPYAEIKGGQGSKLEWEWAEALYQEPSSSDIVSTSSKGNRSEVLGKSFLGYGDQWKISGDEVLPFLWWRSGRYIRLRIAAGAEPLEFAQFGIIETGYPLIKDGHWKSSDAAWDALMPVFENSFQCSAHEQWSDSPYYEQMCYVGDTRLHALSNYAFYGDDRLSKRAIELFAWSRFESGFVAERYPAAWRQESITYSMLWPLMLRDFMLWRDDPIFVKQLLPALRSIMAEMEGLTRDDGLLGDYPGWPFVDWVPEWVNGCGPGVREGDSSIVNLHWVLSLQAAAEVEAAHGDPVLAERCRRMAKNAFDSILDRYWDGDQGLLLDTVGCVRASEHAQFFALLTGLLSNEKTQSCINVLKSGDLAPATIYAAFYLLDAFYHQDCGTELHQHLIFWRGLCAQGFTATPEAPEPSRSDAHAWGSHPMWHSAASIAGIRPSAPGFRSVQIAPQPGSFEKIACSVVHPKGKIEVALQFSEGKVYAKIWLPDEISGIFVWNGATRSLNPGFSEIMV